MKMNETKKSLIIGLLALAALCVWLATRPKPPAEWVPKDSGATLFPAFRDPAEMVTLKIERRNETSGELERLELAREADRWRIKTKSDAPAENIDRIAAVAAPLVGLTVLATASELAGADEEKIETFHRACRLLDPTLSVGSDAADTGILLEIGGADNVTFVRAILGAVPSESASGDLRYLRLADDDRVFTVDFSSAAASDSNSPATSYVERLSTNPLDWMNRDLLRISRWNIAEFGRFAYAADKDGKPIPSRFFSVRQDPDRSIDHVWTPVRSVSFADGKPTDDEQPEAPDGKRVNEAADAVGHLRFDALERFPAAISELFRANRPARELAAEQETFAAWGFFFADHDPLTPDAADPALCGSGGEIRLTMTDGLAYRILFGQKNADESRAVLVCCSFDPAALPAADSADSVAAAEREIALAEGEKKAAENSRRFDDWLYFIPETDYQKIFPE